MAVPTNWGLGKGPQHRFKKQLLWIRDSSYNLDLHGWESSWGQKFIIVNPFDLSTVCRTIRISAGTWNIHVYVSNSNCRTVLTLWNDFVESHSQYTGSWPFTLRYCKGGFLGYRAPGTCPMDLKLCQLLEGIWAYESQISFDQIILYSIRNLQDTGIFVADMGRSSVCFAFVDQKGLVRWV
jgi:hypothetical protein